MNSENKNALQQYLDHMVKIRKGGFGGFPPRELPKGLTYYCADEIVSEKGVFFSPEKLTSEQRDYVDGYLSGVNPKIKQCFSNAQRLAVAEGGNRIKYHEGYGAFQFPILHAWNTIDGKLIDVTWELLDYYDTDVVYKGVEFPREYIMCVQLETERYDSMLCGMHPNIPPVIENEFTQENLLNFVEKWKQQ
jgi:hypothetical protein